MKNIFVIIIATLTSFTSLFYYLMISGQLSELTGEETIAQSLSLGLYLTGMALGSGLCDKMLSIMYDRNHKWKLLIQAEMFVATIGSSLFLIGPLCLAFYLVYVNQYLFSPYDIPLPLIFQIYVPMIFGLGFFSGIQLPILLHLNHEEESQILFLNYLGALFAGVLLNVFLAMGQSTQELLIFVLLLNFFTLFLLMILQRKFALSKYFTMPLLSLLLILNWLPKIEKAELLSYYLGFKIQSLKQLGDWSRVLGQYANLERHVSPYQKIDIVTEPPQIESYFHGNVSLFLNRKPQFDLYSHKTYHQSMVAGSINLNNQIPKKILVLGAGDGILAHELLKHKEVESILMVELDPAMIEISRRHRVLSSLNGGVLELEDPRLKIVINDAISFLRTDKEKYDGIYIDFPYPYSNELKKLYSLEFYQMISAHTNKDGFFIFDFPLESEIQESRHNKMTGCLLNTLKKAGFAHPFGFGPYSSFVFVSKSDIQRSFNYSTLP
ncbi:MAG: hypothetical protein CO099_05925, partial [Bdellovibrio sp. CG_4_9_14_3_um_filter_39_7]